VLLLILVGNDKAEIYALGMTPYHRHNGGGSVVSVASVGNRPLLKVDREQQHSNNPSRIVGHSESIRGLRAAIETVACRGSTVLIDGETGVGKELVAREIHASSPRFAKAFIPADCTAFSSQLIEAQLFGHVKGAFTGAVGATRGFIRCAQGGTLFLDEIGELPLSAQTKLLRAIQERSVVPVGGDEQIFVDIRIVAATHRNLAQMVLDGEFRQDLYYRLNVIGLNVSPLRERREDIEPLCRHFLQEVALLYDESPKVLSPEAQAVLTRYDWPGNVRELRNALEQAHTFCTSGTIETSHLPSEICGAAEHRSASGSQLEPLNDVASIPSWHDAERLLIVRVLKATGGNQSEAARLLEIDRHRLRRKIDQHGLEHLLQPLAN